MSALTVHVLSSGLPICDFTTAVPRDWPEGHQWVHLTSWADATCVECLKRAARALGEKWICDFCSAPDPTREISCRSFTAEDTPEIAAKNAPPMESQGSWMACADCFRFVEANDHDGLFDRAYEAFCRNLPDEDSKNPIVKQALRKFHDQFWENKI